MIKRRELLAMLAASALPPSPVSAAKGDLFFGQGQREIGFQVYALGDDAAKDIDATFTLLATIGYRDLELPNLMGKQPAEIKAAADRAGVKISGVHLPVTETNPTSPGLSLASGVGQIADALGEIGAKAAIAPIMILPENFRDAPGANFREKVVNLIAHDNGDIWRRTAVLLNERAAALKPFGLRVGYHNHNIEFAPVDGTTGWNILTRELDPALVFFEADIGWVAAAGLDPVEFLRAHSGRLRWMHVKDVKASTVANFRLESDSCEIGSGKLDWARILPAARAAGVENFYVEQEPPFAIPRIEAARRSFRYLKRLKA